jgi:hypothetical protein
MNTSRTPGKSVLFVLHMNPKQICTAICYTQVQCTKPALPGHVYCKRHLNMVETSDIQSHEVFEKNIRGIVYYSDKYNHLFSISDIIHRKCNPAIIGRWYLTEEGPQAELFPTPPG